MAVNLVQVSPELLQWRAEHADLSSLPKVELERVHKEVSDEIDRLKPQRVHLMYNTLYADLNRGDSGAYWVHRVAPVAGVIRMRITEGISSDLYTPEQCAAHKDFVKKVKEYFELVDLQTKLAHALGRRNKF